MKLTEWYNGNQKPVRVGVYQRDYPVFYRYYCWWNGEEFGMPALTVEKCARIGIMWGVERAQNLPWRGVQK